MKDHHHKTEITHFEIVEDKKGKYYVEATRQCRDCEVNRDIFMDLNRPNMPREWLMRYLKSVPCSGEDKTIRPQYKVKLLQ